MILKNPNDKSLLFKLESYIKNNWNYISPDKQFHYLIFSEVFSELLVKLDQKEITKQVELSRFFRTTYRKKYEEYNDNLKVADSGNEIEIVRHSRLLFKGFSPSDYLILFKYLNNKTITKSDRLVLVLSKLKLNSTINDLSLINVIGKCNFVALFLINEMGFKKYVEFTELVDQLGMYYPLGHLTDSELVLKIKDKILNKFIDSIQNVNLDSIKTIEKLLF